MLRRSGAKDVGKRFNDSLIQWLGRCRGSSAVAGYVEDAIEELPEGRAALSTWVGVAKDAGTNFEARGARSQSQIPQENFKADSRLTTRRSRSWSTSCGLGQGQSL